MHILIIEDEKLLAEPISLALSSAGHTTQVETDGEAGFAAARTGGYDLIVLDVSLPNLNGFTLLEKLRAERAPTRVIMLTARGDLDDRLKGLRAGADDYLAKPFALEELVARVEVVGRRAPTIEKRSIFNVADVCMDTEQQRVTRNGETVSMSPREYQLLRVFMEEPGRVFSRDEICVRVWNRQHEYDTRTLEVYIVRLRKKLDDGRKEPLFETVRGVGYVMRDVGRGM